MKEEKITLEELLKEYADHLDREMVLVEKANRLDREDITPEDLERTLKSLVSHEHFRKCAVEFPILKETMISIAESCGIENARDIIEKVLEECK